eukprot:3781756-Rhodomonas_salina.2
MVERLRSSVSRYCTAAAQLSADEGVGVCGACGCRCSEQTRPFQRRRTRTQCPRGSESEAELVHRKTAEMGA